MANRATSSDPDSLLSRFSAAWFACGGQPNPAAAYQRLRWHYATGRVYHGFNHVVAMFATADEILGPEALDPEQQIAVFYHDAIYHPGDPLNEQKSAELAVTELGPDAHPDSLAAICTLILATAGHLSDDPRAQIVIDLDLSFLGVDEEVFMANVEKLVSEFSCITSREGFMVGQARYLQPFLSRDFIFYTQPFREHFEERARANLKRFIEQQENP